MATVATTPQPAPAGARPKRRGGFKPQEKSSLGGEAVVSPEHFGFASVPKTPTAEGVAPLGSVAESTGAAAALAAAPPHCGARPGIGRAGPKREQCSLGGGGRAFFGLNLGCGAGEALTLRDPIEDLKLEEEQRTMVERLSGGSSADHHSEATAVISVSLGSNPSSSSSSSTAAQLSAHSSASASQRRPAHPAADPTPPEAGGCDRHDGSASFGSAPSRPSASCIRPSLTPELRASLGGRPALADLISPVASTRVGVASPSHMNLLGPVLAGGGEGAQSLNRTDAPEGGGGGVVDRLPKDDSPASPNLKPVGSQGSSRTRSTSETTKLTASCSRSHSSGRTNGSLSTLESGDGSGGELLYDLILSRDYEGVSELIRTPLGRRMAAISHPHGDGEAFPLNLICDYDHSALRTADERAETGKVVGQQHCPPPADIVLAVLEAHPDAARKRGPRGRLPLHHAARLHLPGEVVCALIRTYPKGLDLRDRTANGEGKKGLTPRDFPRRDPIMEGLCPKRITGGGSGEDDDPILWNSLLNRPSSCWMQQVKDKEGQGRMDEELVELEKEVSDLMIDLEKSLAEEAGLGVRLGQIEADIRRYEQIHRGNELLNDRAKKAEEAISAQLDLVTERVDALIKNMEGQYASDERERRCIADFSSDVRSVYEDIRGQMEEAKVELRELKQALG